MKAILTTIYVCLSLYAVAIEDISLRLNPSFYDEHTKTLYVDVELRYQGHGYFQLADQNYRLFYDSELLSLRQETSRSDLPQDLYSKLQFMEVLEGMQADGVNRLDFDDQLGFVNFNIDLEDAADAGISITDEDSWQRVAVLNFKVDDKEALSKIVWSQDGATNEYATAFVEIMEWVAPNETESATIQEYIGATFNVHEDHDRMNVSISPNPSTDFIKVSFEHNLDQNMSVSVHDAAGREVKKATALSGSGDIDIAVSDLVPGTYTVELIHPDNNTAITQSTFVKVDG